MKILMENRQVSTAAHRSIAGLIWVRTDAGALIGQILLVDLILLGIVIALTVWRRVRPRS